MARSGKGRGAAGNCGAGCRARVAGRSRDGPGQRQARERVANQRRASVGAEWPRLEVPGGTYTPPGLHVLFASSLKLGRSGRRRRVLMTVAADPINADSGVLRRGVGRGPRGGGTHAWDDRRAAPGETRKRACGGSPLEFFCILFRWLVQRLLQRGVIQRPDDLFD
jgi:hypothetical protein